MKILIYGKGYIGTHFFHYLQSQGEEVIWGKADIGNLSEVRQDIQAHNPEVILNCAGKTGRPNVDWCETHREETFYANVTGPLVLFQACHEAGIRLAHLGSGCIYQGDKDGEGFNEEDIPNFYDSYYSQTKAWIDQILKNFPVLQLRLRMPIDSQPGPRNFISKILQYEKIISIPNSMTVVEDLLPAAHELIKRARTGIYNMTNPGSIDHQTILELYKNTVDPEFHYQVMSLEEMYAKYANAKRSNCILNTSKLQKENIHMRPIEEAIRSCLKNGFKKQGANLI